MVRINIGGFELDSNKLPKEGLDYSEFDERTKMALSVFDTDNKKGHLSLSELQKAISFFASQDGVAENDVDFEGNKKVTYHQKDGKLDSYETKTSENAFYSKLTPKLVAKYLEKHPECKNPEEISDAIIIAKRRNLFGYDVKEQDKFMLANMDDALEIIHMAIIANQKGYKQTNIGKYVFQSNDGKFYTYYNGEFYSANKSGRFSIKQKLNEKGQQSSKVYDKDGNFVMLEALNYENKMYEKDYAAKILGFDKCQEGFYRQNTTGARDWQGNGLAFEVYTWDDKDHAFKFQYFTNAVEI